MELRTSSNISKLLLTNYYFCFTNFTASPILNQNIFVLAKYCHEHHAYHAQHAHQIYRICNVMLFIYHDMENKITLIVRRTYHVSENR